MSRKKRKGDVPAEIVLRDLSPNAQEQFRRMLASSEHQEYLRRQAESEAARRKQLDDEYQLHLRRERLREAQDEQRLAEEERRVFGRGERKPTGRPVEITWQMVREARRLLRSEGKKGTQEEVADQLKCTIETVKRRARENGGWSQA